MAIKPTKPVRVDHTEEQEKLLPKTEDKELSDREQAEKELNDEYDESKYDEVIDIEW